MSDASVHKDSRLRIPGLLTRGPLPLRVATMLVPLLFISGGGYLLWIKETGMSAQVEAIECHGTGRREVCTGVATIVDLLGDGTVRTVTVDDVTRADLGNTVQARVSGDRAYATSLRLPIVYIGMGIALFFCFAHVLRNYSDKKKPSPASDAAQVPAAPGRQELRWMVDQALALTRQRLGRADPIHASIETQLWWIAQALDSDTRPDPSSVNCLTLGAVAVREFESTAPEYADLLAKIEYHFGRWAIGRDSI